MDDLNLTMEEYIRFKEEKAHKCGKVFNWKTATYGKIRVDDDLHNLSSVEAEFLAIVINDAVAPQDELQCKSQVSTPVNDEIDFRISFDKSDDEDYTILFDKNSCFDDLDFFTDFKNEFPAIVYNDAQTEPILNPQHIDEFDLIDKTSLSEYDEEEQNVLYFNDLFPFNIIRPDNLKSEKYNDDNMALPPREQRHRFLRYEGLEYLDTEFLISRGILSLVHKRELGRAGRRMSWRWFILALGLHTEEEMQMAEFGVYWARSAKQIPNKGDLRDYWIGISSARDFLGTSPLYTMIQDPILRLCHRLIACSTARRSQAPELFSTRKKSVAHIFRGQFVARLAEHSGLMNADILGRLTVIVPELPVIDMTELASAPTDAEDAPIIDEGDQAILTPVQALQQPPPPPPAAARTIPQRLGRLEEDL
ncbi:hypothetical protein Tco_1114318 [Tanacetum coccineum]|uniref:Uncharacterized protein n=1 Tax=Tanacetum coccineum TaxID=301880 RepID=A0ABQ5IW77_9ASTR